MNRRFPATTNFCQKISIPLATGGWMYGVRTLNIRRIRSHWWQLPWNPHNITIIPHVGEDIVLTLPNRATLGDLRRTWKFALEKLDRQEH